MAKKLGQVIFEELDPPQGRKRIKFRSWLTKAPVPLPASYGGWSKVARPRRKSITTWIGRDPLSIELHFLIDDLDGGDGRAVEKEIRQLEVLAGLEGGGEMEPSLFRLKSEPKQLMPHGFARAPHVKWYIETGPTWDADSVIKKLPAGRTVRIAGSMTITQFVEDSRLDRLIRRGGGRGKGRINRRKWYVVKEGDTLQKIAARKDVYGDAKSWREIAKANKIRDPKKLKVGARLRIPGLKAGKMDLSR